MKQQKPPSLNSMKTIILIISVLLVAGCASKEYTPKKDFIGENLGPPPLPPGLRDSLVPNRSSIFRMSSDLVNTTPTNGLYISSVAVGTNGPFPLPSAIWQGLNLTTDGRSVCVIAWIENTNSWLQSSTNVTSANWVNEVLLTNGVTVWIDKTMRGSNRVYRLLTVRWFYP